MKSRNILKYTIVGVMLFSMLFSVFAILIAAVQRI